MKLIDADTLERKIMAMPDDELCEDCCYNVVNVISDAPTVGGWISVKDRLPEKTGEVIAYSFGEYYVCKFSSRYKAFNANDTDGGDIFMIDDITHWMPLPEPPEEVSGDDP